MRHGWRMLRRSPAFSASAILILALGIGANTALYSVIDAVLVRQIPYAHADRLVWIWSTRTDRDKAFYSIPDFVDTQSAAASLIELSAFANWAANLTGSGEAERLQGVRLSSSAFEMLGVRPAAGRLITPS